MKFTFAIILSALAVVSQATPLNKLSSDAGSLTPTTNQALIELCNKIGGSMTNDVCTTITGTDISAGAATSSGLATVVVKGAGVLEGASITIPVDSAESVLREMGLIKRGIAVDLGGVNLKRGIAVDLGGVNLKRGIAVDLGGVNL